jgi:hypothetical protein
MPSIYNWSTIAADNATADAAVNWAEGQAPSTVNNSARVMMQRVKEMLNDLGGIATVGGGANSLTLTAASAFTAYEDGLRVSFRAVADNTAASTLNVNGIGAKPIVKFTTAGETALVGAEIQQTGIHEVIYSEALNGSAGAWVLLNPSAGAVSAFALTLLDDVDAATARTTLAAAGSALVLTAGNGLSGGGDLTASRSFAIALAALAAKTTLTNPRVVVTDGTTVGSEGRMVPADFMETFTVAGYHTGASANATDYPVGTTLFVMRDTAAALNRNQTGNVYYRSADLQTYSRAAVGNTQLSGTWSCKGGDGSPTGMVLMQKIAS